MYITNDRSDLILEILGNNIAGFDLVLSNGYVCTNYLLGTECRKDPKIIKDYLMVNNKIKKISIASRLLFNKVNNKFNL